MSNLCNCICKKLNEYLIDKYEDISEKECKSD